MRHSLQELLATESFLGRYEMLLVFHSKAKLSLAQAVNLCVPMAHPLGW